MKKKRRHSSAPDVRHSSAPDVQYTKKEYFSIAAVSHSADSRFRILPALACHSWRTQRPALRLADAAQTHTNDTDTRHTTHNTTCTHTIQTVVLLPRIQCIHCSFFVYLYVSCSLAAVSQPIPHPPSSGLSQSAHAAPGPG